MTHLDAQGLLALLCTEIMLGGLTGCASAVKKLIQSHQASSDLRLMR